MRRKIALLVVGLVLSGCSSHGPDPALTTASGDPLKFAAILQSAAGYDYEPFATPKDLLDAADLAVIGTVVDVVQGRRLPGGRADEHLNLIVEVNSVLSGVESKGPEDGLFIELLVGPGISVDALKKEMPTGRVAFFLDDRTDIEALGSEVGRPAGEPIYAPYIQGMIMESGGRVVSALESLDDMGPGWSEAGSFEDFLTELTS